MTRRSPSAYTAMTADGIPKRNRLGLVIFGRNLRAVRGEAANEQVWRLGDYVQGWSSSGAPLARYGRNGRKLQS